MIYNSHDDLDAGAIETIESLEQKNKRQRHLLNRIDALCIDTIAEYKDIGISTLARGIREIIRGERQ